MEILILANYLWFLNITLSSKICRQLGLNQPTDMFDDSAESWEQEEKDSWRSEKTLEAQKTFQCPFQWPRL